MTIQVYFSHSYRDRAINAPFLEQFVEEEIPLVADQKSDVWCVAKLERYMRETTGFVSIIPRRGSEKDPGDYSPYIGYELNLARRARVPRLLFVDRDVLKYHKLDFPEDAVSFQATALESERLRYLDAIRTFGRMLEAAYRPQAIKVQNNIATVITDGSRLLRDVAQDVVELLRRQHFTPIVIAGGHSGRGLDDIRLLEALRRSELCVFILGGRLSDVHIALAMAYSDSIPSLRLQYDRRSADTNPTVTGMIRWRDADSMLVQLSDQLESYARGLMSPVELARASTAVDAVEVMSTMKYRALPENYWNIDDGPALTRHVYPELSFVRDEVDRVRAQLNRALGRIDGREGSMEIASLLYDGLRRYNFAYELEQRTATPMVQMIRTPKQIQAHCTATCIDAACLFASLLDSAVQNALIVILEGPGFAHALAGYRVRGEPSWTNSGLSDLRGAVARHDALLFEATGAFAADAPVGAETANERVDKTLKFSDSIIAAARMLQHRDVTLKHFVDVRAVMRPVKD